MREYDWTVFINKRAALKEQFPSLRALLRERPGCTEDRDRQAFYAADNRLSMIRAGVTPAEHAQSADRDADSFIAHMRNKEIEESIRRYAERKAS